jgi:hypothetical protein
MNSSLLIESDHVPLLVAGVACGGIFSGADGVKTREQRDRYGRLLGHGYGGVVRATFARTPDLYSWLYTSSTTTNNK